MQVRSEGASGEWERKGMKIAILGTGGIGQVHARIFQDLGAEIGNNPDAVSICTPDHLHFGQIMAALDAGKAVFCEKPLFWWDGITEKDIETNLAAIENHPNRRIFLNTPNWVLVDTVRDLIVNPQTFTFTFHTQGHHKNKDIAVDLFSHGASLLLYLFGQQKVKGYREICTEDSYRAEFMYGKVAVVFNFHEDPMGKKIFSFNADCFNFYRQQFGQGDSYKIYVCDAYTGKRYQVEDPFKVSIRAFIRDCKGDRGDGFEAAAANMRLMAECLLGGK
jgi:predicted dehydrogenase